MALIAEQAVAVPPQVRASYVQPADVHVEDEPR